MISLVYTIRTTTSLENASGLDDLIGKQVDALELILVTLVYLLTLNLVPAVEQHHDTTMNKTRTMYRTPAQHSPTQHLQQHHRQQYQQDQTTNAPHAEMDGQPLTRNTHWTTDVSSDRLTTTKPANETEKDADHHENEHHGQHEQNKVLR